MDEAAKAYLAAARGRWTQWEEVVVSNDRGSRLVHYYLRGNGEAKELAVVGRERSPRHMSYAVQGRFLRALAAAAGAVAVAPSPSRSPLAAAGADGGAPRRWRSRREVVDWLSSLVSGRGEVPAMLAAQPQPPQPPEVAGEDESSCHGVFMEFMTKVAQFEELAESGERLLGRFREELEYFRRPQIPKESDVMNQILKSNCTVRMRSYIEAGCRLHCQNISNINQLKTLLEELECLVENVYGITLTASLSALGVSDSQCLDNMLSTDCCSMEGVSTQEEDKSADQLDTDVSFVTVMVMVRNMLKLDYMMQEKIVSALSLKTPSSELEGYCLMWNLRPYIDDDVMRHAWKMCP
ncbi:uncharacterized protein [Miscanthus floridulus]|uniref:uncharacterized protein isoform X2 n=1 Tax=Miscanthus floridulus TaxID=154761 RepID=UPI003458FE5C